MCVFLMFGEERKHLVHERGWAWEPRGPCPASASLWLWGLFLASVWLLSSTQHCSALGTGARGGSLTTNLTPRWAVILAAVRAQDYSHLQGPSTPPGAALILCLHSQGI